MEKNKLTQKFIHRHCLSNSDFLLKLVLVPVSILPSWVTESLTLLASCYLSFKLFQHSPQQSAGTAVWSPQIICHKTVIILGQFKIRGSNNLLNSLFVFL